MAITKEMQDASYRAYDKCHFFANKIRYGLAKGYFTKPYIYGDHSYQELICKDDCLYPTCPFYWIGNLDELRHNHLDDYDEWVVEHYQALSRKSK